MGNSISSAEIFTKHYWVKYKGIGQTREVAISALVDVLTRHKYEVEKWNGPVKSTRCRNNSGGGSGGGGVLQWKRAPVTIFIYNRGFFSVTYENYNAHYYAFITNESLLYEKR